MANPQPKPKGKPAPKGPPAPEPAPAKEASDWTPRARVMGGIGAGVAALAVLFLYLGFSRYMLKSSYEDAMAAYDGGKRNEVRAAADSAASWGAGPEAAELAAKVLVDARQYGPAEQAYEKIAAAEPKRPWAAVGLGVIALRRADEEKDPKKAADLIKRAKEKFGEARALDDNCLEAHIGAAGADLLAALQAGDKARAARVRDEYQKILKRAGAALTREGFVDLFAGLGRSSSAAERHAEAAKYFSACRAYSPLSISLEANLLALEAQQISETAWTPETLKQVDLLRRINELRNRWGSNKDLDPLIDPWVSLVLAAASSYSKVGDKDSFTKCVDYLEHPKVKGKPAAEYGEAALQLERMRAPGISKSERAAYMSKARIALQNAASVLSDSDAPSAERKATSLNNAGCLEEDLGASGSGDAQYQKAVDTLLKALEADRKAGLADGSYEVRRNLAVIQKRRNKPDAQEHYDAALRVGAARGEPAIQKDLEDLKKFWAGEIKD